MTNNSQTGDTYNTKVEDEEGGREGEREREMGRAPCCDKANVKKGPWSPEEDMKLKHFVEKHGTGGNWISLPHKAGLKRCGKSCRLRWLNYLRPNIKHGEFSDEEDRIICSLFASIGSRWSIIASQLPGRTDNDIKNYWNTKLKKKLLSCAPAPSQRGVRPYQYRYHQQQQQNQLLLTSSSPPTSQGISSTSCCYTSAICPTTTLTGTAPGFPAVISAEDILSSTSTTLSATVSAALMALPDSCPYDPMTYRSMVDSGDHSCSSSDGMCTQLMHTFNDELGYEYTGVNRREKESCFHGQVDQAPLMVYNYDQELSYIDAWCNDATNYSGFHLEDTMTSNGERRMAYNF